MKKRNIKGSVLAITILTVVVGGSIVSSLMKYAAGDVTAVEKEIGHIKSQQVLKLASNLFNTTVGNEANLSDSQINTLKELIGGGGINKPIFGISNGGTPSSIPGFEQFKVTWDETSSSTLTNMQPPSDPNGFWYFPGTYSANITALHTGKEVATLREGTRATISSSNEIQTVPVFSMLSFYDRDWEIAAHYESAQCIGHIHSNGSIYLDCRSSGPDRISFHGLQDYPILSANDAVYRRGRNGATSYYKFGSSANAGLDFWIYSSANFNTLINVSDLNYTQNTSRLLSRDLTPDFTSYEEGSINTDSGQEPLRRRFGGGTVGDDYGYVFTGVSSVSGDTFDAPSTDGGTVSAIQFGNSVGELTPPVSINPYQYIEDVQYYDTPDTINYSSPNSSNYTEDASTNNRISQLAFNSISPLVIRDGVAYYRTSVGGNLSSVLNLIKTNDKTLYPDSTHSNAKRYADLRWYGWFGMYDGKLPSPSNPARWHFPLKSVTFNATKDANNAGDSSTSSEGTAVPFTFRNSNIYNPLNDSVINKTGVSLSATWIRRDVDLHQIDLNSDGVIDYPGSNSNAPIDTKTGKGIGMYNVDYPTIGGDTYERYDPVRVAYNVVKTQIRRIYNATHVYTSRHNGIKMLNIDGSDPGDGVPPDLWGSGIDASSFGNGFDYDEDGVNEFSAFLNDDGADGPSVITPEATGYGPINGVTFSNSTYLATPKEGWRAYDGDISTYWEAKYNTMTGEYTKVDLGVGNEKVINKIRFYPRPNSGNFTRSETAKFQASNNNITWTDLYQIPIGSLTSVKWYEVDVFNPTAFRYFRYVTTQTGPARHGQIAEIEFYYDGGGVPKFYEYYRNQSTSNTDARLGNLILKDDDTTPKIELFPVRHKSLHDLSTDPNPNSMNDWYIYRSNLPFNNRTLPMPATLSNINDEPSWASRRFNFGYAENGWHNWLIMLMNAPEMLARNANGIGGITFETTDSSGGGVQGFSYYAGDSGGYYGNDNLCMIDAQEKKIVVFTEIDMSELTKECLKFNGLTDAWGFDFNTNTASVTSSTNLQNIIYVVNTSMGNNFFGKRVHTGAVRLKRGRLLTYPISIASPNAVHIWGDFNVPGYWHHGKGDGNTSVSYNVPTTLEHDTSKTIPSQAVAIYADSIHAYENSWLPFDMSDNSRDSISDQYNGTFLNNLPTSGDKQEPIFFDHKLWWEDDGMRRRGTALNTNPTINSNGAQLFLNYHETIFNHTDNDYYSLPSARMGTGSESRLESSQILKHIPQGINSALMYGNVESRLPCYFYNVDVTNVPARPASVDELDWYMNWIPRNRWVELERNQMRDDILNTVNNGGFNPASIDSNYYSFKLTPNDYFGTNFPGSGNTEWENCKLKFSGGGFMFDVRFHTNHTHNLSEWTSNRQTFGRNIRGAFACLFDSRQSIEGWNQTMMGMENQQIFYSYNLDFNNATKLPPGTPMTNIIPDVEYTIEGTKWEY